MTRLEASIAWRYLRSRRGSSFLSFISVVAMLGVTIAVGALILIIGVMNGLQAGTLAGTVIGLAASFLVGKTRLISLDPAVYAIDHLPVSTVASDVSIIVLAGISIAAAATIYPARSAARLYPVDAIRHE